MDTARFNFRTQRFFACSGIGIAVILLAGMLMADLLPPPRPTNTPAQFADIYSSDKTLKQVGCLLMMVAIPLFAVWGAVITLWVRRAEDRSTPLLTYASLILLGVATTIFSLIPMTWAATIYRAGDISPDVTTTLQDWVWFVFLYSWPPYALWLACIATAILRDPHETLPRWLGYASLGEALMLFPAGLMAFFKTGPFAYNGAISFYVPLFGYLCWMVAITVTLLTLIKKAETAAKLGVAPDTEWEPLRHLAKT